MTALPTHVEKTFGVTHFLQLLYIWVHFLNPMHTFLTQIWICEKEQTLAACVRSAYL